MLCYVNDRNRSIEELSRIISYASRDGTLPAEQCGGIGIYPEDVFGSMQWIKKLYHQEGGKQYLHIVISHDSALNDIQLAHRVDMQIASFYGKEFQVAVFTHSDTDHLHSHLIVNTVHIHTGKKLSQGKEVCKKLKSYANSILQSYGLEAIGGKDIRFYIYDAQDATDEEEFYGDDELSIREWSEIAEEIEEITGITRPFRFTEIVQEREDVKRFVKNVEERQCEGIVRPITFVDERQEMSESLRFIRNRIKHNDK